MSGRCSSVRSLQNRPPKQDRLIAEGEKRKEKREKIKLDTDIEEMKEWSFQPKIKDYNLIPRDPKMN